MIATLAITAALAFHPMPHVTAHELPRAERATGRTVLCLSPKAMNALAARWHRHEGSNFWDLDDHAILLDDYTCDDLRHPVSWFAANPAEVADAIFMLGHEAAHARQQDLGLPFSEHQADCWSKAGFQTLKQRLRIRLRVTFTMSGRRVRCS